MGRRLVQSRGQPINFSTHCGFRRPPATTFNGSLLRRVWLGAALFFASCTVGVGNFATAVRKSIPPVPCNPGPFASLARGVGHDPDSLALVGGAAVVCSEHSPSRIEPHRGQVSEYGSESP